MESIIFKTKHK